MGYKLIMPIDEIELGIGEIPMRGGHLFMISYSVEDYTKALISLAPHGLAWNWKSDSAMYSVLNGLAWNYHISDIDSIQLLRIIS